MTDKQALDPATAAKALVMLREGAEVIHDHEMGGCYVRGPVKTRKYPNAIDALAAAFDATHPEGEKPGYVVVEAVDMEEITLRVTEAAEGKQYDPSWIRPKTLSTSERVGRMKEVALRLAAALGEVTTQ